MKLGISEEAKLGSVEKLLILGLLRDGLSQTQISGALGIHQTSLSRAFPKGLLAEVSKLAKQVSTTEP